MFVSLSLDCGASLTLCFVPLLLQFERVRVIYKYALDRIPKHQAQELFKFYTMFEKKFGDRRGIEDVIVSKRRFQYEEEVKVFIMENQYGNIQVLTKNLALCL